MMIQFAAIDTWQFLYICVVVVNENAPGGDQQSV